MAKKDRSSNNNKTIKNDYNANYTSYLNQENSSFSNNEAPPAEEVLFDPFSSTSALVSEDSLSLIPPPSFNNDNPFGSTPTSSFNDNPFGSSSSPSFNNDNPFGSTPTSSFNDNPFGSSSSSSFGSGNDPFGSTPTSSFNDNPFGSTPTSSFNDNPFGSSSSSSFGSDNDPFASTPTSSFGSSDFNSFTPSPEPIVPAFDHAKEAELETARIAEENAKFQLEQARIDEENAQKAMQLEAIRLQEEQDLIENAQRDALREVEEKSKKEAEIAKEPPPSVINEDVEDLESMSIEELKDNINKLKANPGNTIDEKLLVFDKIGKYSTVLLKKLRAEKK